LKNRQFQLPSKIGREFFRIYQKKQDKSPKIAKKPVDIPDFI